MNPSGKSFVCILHEYVQHALKKQPTYKFKELENAATPYSAIVCINDMEYGVGFGSSKKQAKADAARKTLEILIPQMRDKILGEMATDSSTNAERIKASRGDTDADLSFFDDISITDPRVAEFCAKTTEPSPHAILVTCLQRNFGLGDVQINYSVNTLKHQQNEFTMKVGKHEAKVVCRNKKEGKQQAAQAILKLLHPSIPSWGSLLRLYGSRSVKSFKEKKQQEQEITLLQGKAAVNQPNHAILNKLRHEMKKLSEQRQAVQPIDEDQLDCQDYPIDIEEVKIESNVSPKNLNEERPFICDSCSMKFLTKGHLKRHMQVHTDEKQFTCDTCSQQFRQKCNLKLHMQKHSKEKPFKCKVCSAKFGYRRSYEYHMLMHEGVRPYECEYCSSTFRTRNLLKNHVLIHKGEKPFACKVCYRTYRNKYYLKIHMRMHTGERPYQCDICPAKFAILSNLSRHMRVHTGEKPFGCELCSARFGQKVALQEHQLIHQDQRPFECDLCTAKFRVKRGLKIHMRTHKKKPFICEVCSQKFSDKAFLDQHMYLRHNTVPYKCNVCNQLFRDILELNTHLLVHRSEPLFVCDTCSAQFYTKEQLSKHQAMHLVEKSYICRVCSATYRIKSEFLEHVMNHQEIDASSESAAVKVLSKRHFYVYNQINVQTKAESDDGDSSDEHEDKDPLEITQQTEAKSVIWVKKDLMAK
ncbi:Similar to ZNF235: Zinc finger protein 235 (Homo sapiens) [Cotesia congregata]|uniref:Similar to ZNF235: Zinc finger protein 235 (Homo sapiens) n=1 Tax=Cotesia congregata TaxID=51543 RepID=A0A8J2HCU6_COTCN|nr:Similar to ZNF235: Zinc finger protein 235 (Homo sapiens) [Cotesia congregata]